MSGPDLSAEQNQVIISTQSHGEPTLSLRYDRRCIKLRADVFQVSYDEHEVRILPAKLLQILTSVKIIFLELLAKLTQCAMFNRMFDAKLF